MLSLSKTLSSLRSTLVLLTARARVTHVREVFLAQRSVYSNVSLFMRCLYHEIVINDKDIDETFVKGWGKGGQKVNKTSNCVELRHKPTGLAVKCHQTRSLTRNRTIAREILQRKLDSLYNGAESDTAQEIAKIRKRKAAYSRKRRTKENILRNMDNQKDGSGTD